MNRVVDEPGYRDTDVSRLIRVWIRTLHKRDASNYSLDTDVTNRVVYGTWISGYGRFVSRHFAPLTRVWILTLRSSATHPIKVGIRTLQMTTSELLCILDGVEDHPQIRSRRDFRLSRRTRAECAIAIGTDTRQKLSFEDGCVGLLIRRNGTTHNGRYAANGRRTERYRQPIRRHYWRFNNCAISILLMTPHNDDSSTVCIRLISL